MSRLRWHGLGLFLLACCAALTRFGPLAERVGDWLPIYLVASGALLVVLAPLWRDAGTGTETRTATGTGTGTRTGTGTGTGTRTTTGTATVPAPPRSAARTLGSLLFWALLLRVVLLVGTEPSLSDDVYRYVWEGRLVALGGDPYDLAPDAPQLAELARQAPEWPLINHRSLPAIYPPGAQLFFAAIAAVSPTVVAFRVALVAVDLALVAALFLLLRGRRQDGRLAALYAWHPLVAVEVASSGHYEPLALLPLVLGVLAWQRRRAGPTSPAQPAWFFWGLGLSTKLLGALPAGFAALQLLRRPGPPRQRLIAAFGGLVVVVAVGGLLALPFALDGSPPLGSLGTYARHWAHNGSVHALLTLVIGFHPARLVVAALAAGWLGFLLWRGEEPGAGFLLFFAGLMLLSPVVHPWYGLWLLVLLPLRPSGPLLLLCSLLPLAYLAWTTPAGVDLWEAPVWARLLEYGLPLAWWLLASNGRRRRPAG